MKFILLIYAILLMEASAAESIFSGIGKNRVAYRKWAIENNLYERPFDKKEWDNLAPLIREPLSQSQSEWLLLRFQKPEGLDAGILSSILASREGRKHPKLIAGALQTLLLVSPSLYVKTVQEFSFLQKLKLAHWINPFQTQLEREKIHDAAITYINSKLNRLIPTAQAQTVLSDWLPLAPLGSCLLEKDEDIADDIMESMVFHAMEHELKGLFPSLIARFAYQTTIAILGGEWNDDSSLEVVRNGKTLTPYLIGTEPLYPYQFKNPYGFYTQRLTDIPVTADPKSVSYAWQQGEDSYQGKIKLLPLFLERSIVSREVSPPYSELWKGGRLDGLVVFGSNLEDEVTDVLEDYLKYFRENGFVEEPRKPILDVKEYLKHQIISAGTRWLIKEAHSDGDSSNVLEVADEGELILFKKGSETVQLMLAADADDSSLITNEEFGRWMQQREEQTHIPLVYLNASCWSADKAQNEIPEAHTPFLIEIVTTSITDVFRFEEGNALRIILDGLRKSQSYPQIRENLKANADYLAGVSDVFLFPDEERYHEQVLKEQNPLIVRIDIDED